MEASTLRKIVDAIDANEIKYYTIWGGDSDEITVNPDSMRVIFDDDNEVIWFFRIPNMVSANGKSNISLNCMTYDQVTKVYIPTDFLTVKDLASSIGLTLTEDVTTWLKTAASQTRIHPLPSSPAVDEDGNPILYNGIPTIH